ncbi:MAG TPA: alpha/beta fold hydrolase [Actinomycetota bacterium]|nr:alpha/beta fold hydrolase [Actinomycetota bacterium]
MERIRYTDGELQIAYQVTGQGDLDLVFAFDWASNVELIWQHPSVERFLRRLASFSRLILFDTRGMGLSDPIAGPAPLEEWMDDVRAVMDAVGSERAALVGHGHGGQLGLVFAAAHPERTHALVTINSFARLARALDYRPGMPANVQRLVLEQILREWGTGTSLAVLAPALTGDERAARWWASVERAAGSPRRAAHKQQLVFETDVRHVLPTIAVPTLILQSAGNPYVIAGHGRYLAEHIPGARYVELPGEGHWPWASADALASMDTIEEFLTGTRSSLGAERVLATVAFTDIVGSTELAAELGDARWRELLETHDSVANREITAARGHLVKTTGDGVLATFDGPARAIRAVRATQQALAAVGLPMRGGLHAGEVEVRGEDIGGIAVHIASRVAGLADAGEVLVSSTVRDLVAGSGLEFDDRGAHELRGVPDEWRVFALAS